MKTNKHFRSYLVQFFLECKIFQKDVLQKIKTHFTFDDVFRKSYLLWDNVEKCCRAWQATDDKMAHAHCMLDSCKCTHRLCNTSCFLPVTVVVRKRFNVTLYVHCFSSIKFKLTSQLLKLNNSIMYYTYVLLFSGLNMTTVGRNTSTSNKLIIIQV